MTAALKNTETKTTSRETFDVVIAACRDDIRTYLRIRPCDNTHRQRQEISRHIPAGIYMSHDGVCFRVYGIKRADDAGDIETAFHVSAKHIGGEKAEQLVSLPVFGEIGFLEPVQFGDQWVARYKLIDNA